MKTYVAGLFMAMAACLVASPLAQGEPLQQPWKANTIGNRPLSTVIRGSHAHPYHGGSRAPALGVSDLRVGNFGYQWCNYGATFQIQSKEPDKWVFHGKILIQETGQYDRLWIEQYEDNSLRIIRYLSGAHNGETQVVQTHPPQIKLNNGKSVAEFREKAAYGVGAKGAITVFEIQN